MRKNNFVPILYTLILTSGALMAQITYPHNKRWEVSFSGGVGIAGEKTAATRVTGAEGLRLSTFDYASGYVLGVRITENLGAHAGAELEYSFANHPLVMYNVKPDVARLPLDHFGHNILYNMVFYTKPRASRLRPFLGFGVGATLFQIGSNSKVSAEVAGMPLKDTWKFAYGFTGGLKSMVSRNWGIRVEFRNIWTGVPSYGIPSVAEPTGPGFAGEGLMNRWQFSGGLSYYWGR